MHLEELYPLQGFQQEQIRSVSGEAVGIFAASKSNRAICPYCQTYSARRHSSYLRKPQACPCANYQVSLYLTVQRYFCDNPVCAHRTFAERLPDLVAFYARCTFKLHALLQTMAFEMSAETGARVAASHHVCVSPDTLLRLVRKAPLPFCEPVRVLGVDDWAFKRGQNYGAILVDLERGRPIELLPDRTQATLRDWLQAHPGIEIVSRDRSFEFKAGIEAGAPQARQVVDRWHLLHNLKERLQEILPKLLQKTEDTGDKKPSPTYEKRRQYFELVNALAKKGYSQRLIARILDLSRGTVRRYIMADQVPDWQPKVYRASELDRYENYLRQRWEGGCQDSGVLWEELKAQGYTGQRNNVARYVQRFQQGRLPLSFRQITWLFLKRPETLASQEQEDLQGLLKAAPRANKIYQLIQSFLHLFDQGSSEEFDAWLREAATCESPKLRHFAAGLRLDYEAVKAAFELDWSNGQVEGQVNRLKMIKRQMYGRAKFDLLRARVLGPP